MKKKIIIIAISAIIALFCVVLCTKPLWDGALLNQNQSPENTVSESDEQFDATEIFTENYSDLVLFEDDTFNLNENFYALDMSKWNITYMKVSSCIEIQNGLLKILSYDSDRITIKVSIMPNFDISNLDDLDKTFPYEKTFNLTILPSDLDLQCIAETVGNNINDFNVYVSTTQNISLDISNISVINIEDFSFTNIAKINNNKLCFENVKLKDKMNSNFEVLYNLKNTKGEIKQNESSCNINQNFSNISVFESVSSNEDGKIVLYKTVNDEFCLNYPNKLDLDIIKNFELNSNICRLTLILGNAENIVIDQDELVCTILHTGVYKISLIINDIHIKDYDIVCENISIQNAFSENTSFECLQGESVDISPIYVNADEHIDSLDNHAEYTISYRVIDMGTNLENLEISTTLNNNSGVFSSESSGAFLVEIMVGDFYYQVQVTVNAIVYTPLYLEGVSPTVIDEHSQITINIEGPTEEPKELSLCYTYSDIKYRDYFAENKQNITFYSNNQSILSYAVKDFVNNVLDENFIAFTVTGLHIFLNLEDVDSNDYFEINFSYEPTELDSSSYEYYTLKVILAF